MTSSKPARHLMCAKSAKECNVSHPCNKNILEDFSSRMIYIMDRLCNSKLLNRIHSVSRYGRTRFKKKASSNSWKRPRSAFMNSSPVILTKSKLLRGTRNLLSQLSIKKDYTAQKPINLRQWPICRLPPRYYLALTTTWTSQLRRLTRWLLAWTQPLSRRTVLSLKCRSLRLIFRSIQKMATSSEI